MKSYKLAALAALAVTVSACSPASEHAREVNEARSQSDRLTVGTVQREIRQGMSGAEVASALGAPNVVTSDERRRETWVYDRISTERVVSESSGGVNALFLAAGVARAGAAQTSQRSLTVIIRFDENGRVRDFSYRQSSF
jgi:outer membrane protein assembly factor BamE (lipoprotein component of BamABCDE complex)